MGQNRPRFQSINMGIRGQRTLATGFALTGPTGSVDDTVLRFTAANTVVTGQGIVVADTAANGTVITLTSPGVYHCLAQINTTEQAGITTAVLAITLNSTILNADPTFAGGALVLTQNVIQLTAGVNEYTNMLSAFVTVTKGSTQIVRFQASDGANGAPTNLNVAVSSFAVVKVSARG